MRTFANALRELFVALQATQRNAGLPADDGKHIICATSGRATFRAGRRSNRPRSYLPRTPAMTSPSISAARSTWASSIHSSAVWVIPPWRAVCFGVRSHRRGNAALAWEIGFFEREKEKAPSSRRTPKFPLGYSPTTPANARVQRLPSNSKCHALALSGRAGPPDPPST
jgi:hypothetical protein